MDPNDQNQGDQPAGGGVVGDGQDQAPAPTPAEDMPGTGAPEITPPPPVVGGDDAPAPGTDADSNEAGGGDAPAV